MATETTTTLDNIVEDVSLCTICFEKLKLPRYLPCTHTFCHACLVSFIASCCKSKVAPLGFHCPLCREFIPCVGEQTRWVEQFPIDEMLMKFIEELDGEKLCEPCKLDNEENEATDFCSECNEAMCETCTKYHRKLVVSRDHRVCPLTKVKGIGARPDYSRNCRQHRDRRIEMYCNDHEEPCCALCASTRHRKCDSVDTLETAAENIRKSDAIQLLIGELESHEGKLDDIRKSQEENMAEIEDVSDALAQDAEKLEEDFVNHISKLKNTYLDELSKLTKESKEKTNKNTEHIMDESDCVKKCKQTLSSIDDKTDIAEQVIKFSRSKQMFHHMKQAETKNIHLALEVNKCCEFDKIKNQVLFPKLKLQEFNRGVLSDIDLRNAELTVVSTFTIKGGQVFSGIYLKDKRMIFPQYTVFNKNRIKYRYILFNEEGKVQQVIGFPREPVFVRLHGEEVYLSSTEYKIIAVVSSQTFEIIREVPVPKRCFGLDIKDDFLYIACCDSIEKMDNRGKVVYSYQVPEQVECVIVTNQGDIVYSVWSKDIVSAINKDGENIWTYTGPNLKFPFGLERDSKDNIYIAGKESGNIHVLSSEGALVRILENMKKPWFVAISPDDSTCCVCSDNKVMTIYRIH
ncbi:E3 ubiquitin-protein ligase Midline-1-like [Ostrea edulis]|uniref:E3 ubiquitin-protein ligase Midline-1-like n=1 Tax=Ostrea edulis TaxID=37623 RepID=UPI0020941242|nr:E3 ubiquitin-protein ligase Midline-1-like [Ostrea edulis]